METGASPTKAGLAAKLEVWNRRLHYYLGLYLLFFVWLFAFSGLLLNHSSWSFAEFWPNRKESTATQTIVAPPAGNDFAQATDLMRQLGIVGEIEWTASGTNANRLDFRLSQPGRVLDIKADYARQEATVKRIEFNGWGFMRTLHTFSGVRRGDARNERDWVLTRVWVFAMDAVAAGLIVMVLSSLYMWYKIPQKRRWGAISLLLGCGACGLFCFGLRWMF